MSGNALAAQHDRFRAALTPRVAARLLELRGWTPEALERLGLGFDGQRVTFPVRDATCDLLGFLHYAPSPNGDERKMLADAGVTRELFPPPEAIRDEELRAAGFLWLVEGEPDAVRLWSCGVPAVAVPGAGNWRSEWAPRFCRGVRVIACGDCDEAGREGRDRAGADLVAVGVDAHVLDLGSNRDDGYDLSDLLASATDAGMREQAAGQLRAMAERAPAAGNEREERRSGDREPFETSGEKTIPERRGFLIRASDVKPEPVVWLWEPYIPLRAVTLLAGDPGIGKSLLTIWLGAELTRASRAVIFSSVEDDRSSVIVPRLIAADADLELVRFFVIATKDVGEDIPLFPDDVDELERTIMETGARLLVIDPINAQLGASVESTYNDRQIRRALAPLHRLAVSAECAVVVLMHLNKDTAKQALYRVGGSVGYTGAARSVLGMAIHPGEEDEEESAEVEDDDGERLVEIIKSNYGRRGHALKLRIDEMYVPELPPGQDAIPTIRVVGPSDARMEDAIGERRKSGQPTKLDQAKLLLAVELAGGARPATEIEEFAAAKGISERTLNKARKQLDVEAFKESFDSAWWLRLTKGANAPPGDPGNERVAPFDETRSASGFEGGQTAKGATLFSIGADVAPFGDFRAAENDESDPKEEPS